MTRKQRAVRFATCVGLCALLCVPGLAQAPGPAVPIDPIAAIVEAFETHDIVALAEGSHANEQGHAFRLSLIRDPRFTAIVDDIVVEFGAARYQDVMDRFVRGEDVPNASLRRAWQNTTQPHAGWDVPIYEEFFRAVRDVNASLAPGRQLRVLLGDPPIEWESVNGVDDLWIWGDRDGYPVDLIKQEVLAKQRRALVVYGDGHLLRKEERFNYQDTEESRGVVMFLEQSTDARVFSVFTTNARQDLRTRQPDIASWSTPSLTLLRGTKLGAADWEFFSNFDWPGRSRYVIRNGEFVDIPRSQWRLLPMEDQFDALLYLGQPSAITFSTLPPTVCDDSDYMEMRLGRIALTAFPDQTLQRLCGGR